MMPASKRHSRHERDYIERTIATVRNHRDADNCWPQWANIFADEIEHLYEQLERAETVLRQVLNCKGPFEGTVSARGGYPAICTDCERLARDALASNPASRDEA